ncbi:MAG: EamA family transporter RarD [Acidobacteriota bacterium]|nr:EamA family transporter RarD [Acidobacteriota bacterium]
MGSSPARVQGVIFALAAYLWWGLVPVYFKAVHHVPLEVLAHRVAWCVLLLLGWMLVTARAAGLPFTWPRRPSPTVFITTTLIATNWLIFIWAVFNDQVLQASLGYFINPLLSVLLGRFVLGEHLRPLQWSAVGVATGAVTLLTVARGELPAVALVLAGSFALYGLLRKRSRLEATEGLLLETLLLLPAALGYLVVMGLRGELAFLHVDRSTDLLLLAAGPVTALPLLWYVAGARRLRLATMGLLQYLAPSLHFALAVLVYGEQARGAEIIAFGGVWCALLLYNLDVLRSRRTTAGDPATR